MSRFMEQNHMTESNRSPAGARRGMLAAALLAGTILAGGGIAWSQAGVAAPEATAPLGLAPVANQAGFAPLVAKVKAAVVNIATDSASKASAEQQMPQLPEGTPWGDMLRRFHNQQSQPVHALGSGFIVDPAGYVVTNNHVIDGANKITVTLDGGQSYPAKIVGHDEKTDVAVLKIEAGKPLPYVAFGPSNEEHVGDWVVAIGNPFGLGGTVTAGIVSGHDRNIDGGPYDDYLQIDAPINPGNSGGPLFNQSGQVIGIDTAIYSPTGGSVGIGFAIPSDMASKVVAQLREHGSVTRGWLGIAMQPLTQPLAKAVGRSTDEGVLVDQVMDGSPASRAKLEQGDIVTAFDGKPIKTPRDLAIDVANAHAGDSVKLTLWREGQERTAEVVIGNQSQEKQAEADQTSGDGAPVGMMLAPLDAQNREQAGVDASVKGVLVEQVMPQSRAASSGLQSGDVILRVGHEAVTSPAQVKARITAAQHEKKDAVPLLVMRNGNSQYLALELKAS
jgi:serine protease Do